MAENSMLYPNFTALSSIEPELLLIEVVHCGNREIRFFVRKIMEMLKFPVSTAKLIQIYMETHNKPNHILWPVIDCYSMICYRVAHSQNVVLC